MSIITKNLGLVQAIHVSTTAPANVFMLWLDVSTTPAIHKYYNTATSQWESLVRDSSNRPPVDLVFNDSGNPLPLIDTTLIDGVTVLDGDRVLVLDSSTASEVNKIYAATVIGGVITWTVQQDGTNQDDPTVGDFLIVLEGTIYANTQAFFTGITWIIGSPHTQNTDTGTTQTSFDIESGGVGVKLKNVAGELQLRDLGDIAYGDLRVGNLVVEGTQTIVNSEIVEIADNIIVLNSNVTSGAPTEDGGIHIRRGDEDNASILWNETTDRWTAGIDAIEKPILLADLANVISAPTSLDYGNYALGMTSTKFKLERADINDIVGVGVDAVAAFLSADNGTDVAGITADITNGIILSDDIFNIGARYAADYSAAGILDPLWIPHFGYLEQEAPWEKVDSYNIKSRPELKGQGQVTLTNGSGAIAGVGTNFDDGSFNSLGTWLSMRIIDSNGDFFEIFNITVTSAVSASIGDVADITLIESGFAAGAGPSTWQGVTGTYDYYLVENKTQHLPGAFDGFSIAGGANSYAGPYSTAFARGYAPGNSSLASGNFAIASGNRTTAFGEYVRAYADYAMSINTRTIADGLASFSGGRGIGDYVTSTSTSKWVLAGGDVSFNFSENTAAQVAGYGAMADNSAILGGIDNHIPSDSPRSAILGGSGIIADATLPDMVYVPEIRSLSKVQLKGTGTYISEAGANQFGIYTANVLRVLVANNVVAFYEDAYVSNTSGAKLVNIAATATVPSILNNRANLLTGVGGAAGEIDLITNSVSRLNISDTLITANKPLRFPIIGDGIEFGSDGDTGFYESVDNVLRFKANDVESLLFYSGGINGVHANAFRLLNISASDTIPNIISNRQTGSTGIGGLNNQISIIINSVNKLRVSETLSTFSTVVSGVEPTIDAHFTTKGYVDRIASQDSKDSAELATTANLALLSGEQTIDGILTSNSRILVKNQSVASFNGIYITSTGAWSRSADADDDNEVTSGMKIWVDAGGTLNGNTEWTLTTANPIVVGTTGLVFSKTGEAGYIDAQNGLTKNGNFIELGGTLIQATEINTDTFALSFSGTGGLDVKDNEISSSTGGVKLNDYIIVTAQAAIRGSSSQIQIRNVGNTAFATLKASRLKLETSGTFDTEFTSTATAPRDISFPDLSGTAMLNLVEDITPQLGGNLDLQSFSVIGSGIANTTSGFSLGSDTLWLNHATNTGMEIDFGVANPSIRRKDDAAGIIFEDSTYTFLGSGGSTYLHTDLNDTINRPSLSLGGQRTGNSGAAVSIRNIAPTPFSHATGNQQLLNIDTSINQTGAASFDWIRGNLNITTSGSGEKNIINLSVGGSNRFKVSTDGYMNISLPQTAAVTDDEILVRTSTGEIKQRNISDIAGDHALGDHSDVDLTGIATGSMLWWDGDSWEDTGSRITYDGTATADVMTIVGDTVSFFDSTIGVSTAFNVNLPVDDTTRARLGNFYAVNQSISNARIGGSINGTFYISGDNLWGGAAGIVLSSRGNTTATSGFQLLGSGSTRSTVTSGGYNSIIRGTTTNILDESGGDVLIDGGIKSGAGAGADGNVLLATNRGQVTLGQSSAWTVDTTGDLIGAAGNHIELGVNQQIKLDNLGTSYIYSPADGFISIALGGIIEYQFNSGGFIPQSDLGANLGTPTQRFANLYTLNINTDTDTGQTVDFNAYNDIGGVPAFKTFATLTSGAVATFDLSIDTTVGTNQIFYDSLHTTLAGYGITDAQPLDADLTAIAGLAGTTGFLTKTAADTWTLDTSTYLTANQTITLSGDISGSGATAITTTIGANKVTLGMMAQIATDSFLGRITAATGNVEVLTNANAKTMLDLAGSNSGDQTITLTSDVTGTGTGSFATTIANNVVSLAKMTDVASATIFYRKTAGAGDPEVQTLATLKTDLGLTGTNSGDQTDMSSISDTKVNFNTALSDGTFIFEGDSRLTDARTPTSHTLLSHTIVGETLGHVLAADSATTYSIRQLLGSEISNDQNWISDITGETLSDLSDVPAEPTAGALTYVLRYNDTGDVFTWYDDSNYLGGGTIGGSITNDQIAFGATTADQIEGTADLRYNGTNIISFGHNDTEAWDAATDVIEGQAGNIIFGDNTSNSHSVSLTAAAWFSGTTWNRKTGTDPGAQIWLDISGDIGFRHWAAGTIDSAISFTSSITVKNNGDVIISGLDEVTNLSTYRVVVADGTLGTLKRSPASTNVATEYLDGTGNWSTPSGSGDVIAGTHLSGQVAYWSATDTISGDGNLTFDGATLTANNFHVSGMLLTGVPTTSTDALDHILIRDVTDGEFKKLGIGTNLSISGNDLVASAGTFSGSIAANQVAYGTAADTLGGTNDLFWDITNGRLGIGTATPLRKLDIADSTPYLRLTNTTQLGDPAWDDVELGGIEFYTEDVSGAGAHIGASIRAYSQAAGAGTTPSFDLIFSTSLQNVAANEKMRIDYLGNVGIGIASPGGLLHLSKSNIDTTVGGNDNPQIRIANEYQGAFGSYSEMQFWSGTSGVLSVIASKYETWDATYGVGGGLHFFTDNSDVNGLTEKMTIKGDGNVGIGTDAPSYILDVRETAATATLGVQNETAFATSNGVTFEARLATSTTHRAGLQIITKFTDVTDATRTSKAMFYTQNNGTFAERMVINGSKVGIAVTSPAKRLHVVGDSNEAGAVITSSGNTYLQLDRSASNRRVGIAFSTAGTLTEASAPTSGLNWVIGVSDSDELTGDALFFGTSTAANSGVKMVIETGGNVGIGTSNPLTKFAVSNEGAEGLEVDPSGLADGVLLTSYDRVAVAYQEMRSRASKHAWAISATVKMALDTNGNLGVGTDFVSSNSASLGIDNEATTAASITWGATAGQIFRNENSEFAFGLQNASPFPLFIQGRTSTNAARDIVLQPLGGDIGIGTTSPSFSLDVDGEGRFTGDLHMDDNAELQLGTSTPDLTFYSTGAHTVMNIVNGNLYIFDNATTPTGTADWAFHADGTGDFHAMGDIVANSSSYSSDVNLKENIVNITPKLGLEITMKLGSKEFNKIGKQGLYDGYIAQEVQQFLPHLVKSKKSLQTGLGVDDKEYLHLDYISILPYVSAAVQYQNGMILNNKSKLEKLEDEINKLNKEIKQLKNR